MSGQDDDQHTSDQHTFDQAYWDRHYRESHAGTHPGAGPGTPNPHLVRETAGLPPGTALDAGCGEGAEALWLAEQGWQVTAVDIASDALDRARSLAAGRPAAARVRWLQADLGSWVPDRRFDLVTTHYAHPAVPQLDFYDRLAEWVAPGGTLLVVGHLHRGSAPGHGEAHGHGRVGGHGQADGHGAAHEDGDPPAHATVTASAVAGRLGQGQWEVVTADERSRAVTRNGVEALLHDVVVRATRRG